MHQTKLPVLFVGHGSPMNAIEDNEFTRGFRYIATTFPKPKAVLCLSAHWETAGTWVTAMENPKTIHDFGGFPQALYQIQYPAKGNPSLAEKIQSLVHTTRIGLDYNWGIDHGTWAVLKYLYPAADIPTLQLSLDYNEPMEFHCKLVKELAVLRDEGVLIMGSGNIVHNLQALNWRKPDTGYDWAIQANKHLIELINNNALEQLINYESLGEEVRAGISTREHYLPMPCMLALREDNEPIELFNNKVVLGSLSMASFKIG